MIPSDTIEMKGEVGNLKGKLQLRKNKTEEDEGIGIKNNKDDLKSHSKT